MAAEQHNAPNPSAATVADLAALAAASYRSAATVADLAARAADSFQRAREWRVIAGGSYPLGMHGYGLVATHLEYMPPEGVERDRVQRGPERALCAQGWRFLPIPTRPRAQNPLLHGIEAQLEWRDRPWLAVPPESCTQPARRFVRKGDALAWAAAISAPAGGEGA